MAHQAHTQHTTHNTQHTRTKQQTEESIMLAADKLQLQSSLKQQATALKEKEFNLHHSNLSTFLFWCNRKRMYRMKGWMAAGKIFVVC